MINQNLVCSQCEKKADYRDKLGKEYCYECYWNLGENKYNKPKGELFSDNNYYRSCPFCNSGDICSTKWCIAKCKQCGIIDKLDRMKYKGQNYCSRCIDIVKEESEEKSSEERQRKVDEIDKQIKKLLEIDPKYLTIKDYREVMSLQKQLEVLIKECNQETDFNPSIILKKSTLKELEKTFPEWIKFQTKKKECDTHQNINWKEEDIAYCLDCGESESKSFLRELKKLMVKDIRNICSQCGISSRELEKEYPDLTLLKKTTTEPSDQKWLYDVYQKVAKRLKGDLNDDNQESRIKNQESRIKNQESRIKNQESRIKNQESRIKQQISNLESIPNRTAEQESKLTTKKQELKELEKKLAELENQQNQNQKPKNSGLGWKIRVGVLVGVGLVSLMIAIVIKVRKIKANKHYD